MTSERKSEAVLNDVVEQCISLQVGRFLGSDHFHIWWLLQRWSCTGVTSLVASVEDCEIPACPNAPLYHSLD